MTTSFSIHNFTLSGEPLKTVSIVYVPEKGARKNPAHLAAEAGLLGAVRGFATGEVQFRPLFARQLKGPGPESLHSNKQVPYGPYGPNASPWGGYGR